MLESLGALTDSMLAIDFDVCTSRDEAIRRLLDCPYQVIISGVYLAELNDFLLIKQKHAHQRYTPLVVTANASETDSASRALRRGAFDVITNPLDPLEARTTIQVALCNSNFSNSLLKKSRPWKSFISIWPIFQQRRIWMGRFNAV
jgi:DNA-binding NtrC family response regulator